MDKIGIVTLLYNSAEVLEGYFHSLERQSFRAFTLYIVDNASPDDSLQRARSLAARATFPTVIIAEKENHGIAEGTNIGIRRALADGCSHILMSNNDVEFGPATIATLLDSLTAEGVDMATPKIFFYDSGLIWSAGGKYRLRTPTENIGHRRPDSPRYSRRRLVDFTPGTFLLIRREVFEKTGLLDPRFFVYYEDTDLLWRAIKQHGFKLLFEPAATVRHKVSTSTSSLPSLEGVRMNVRSATLFMKKYFPWHRRVVAQGYFLLRYTAAWMMHRGFPGPPALLSFMREGIKLYREGNPDTAPH